MEKTTNPPLFFETMLKEHGFKITKGRVLLLKSLASFRTPVTASMLQAATKHELDKVTLYRALESFVSAKLVKKVYLGLAAAHYELYEEKHHHHHVICTYCGTIKDIGSCHEKNLTKEVLREAKNFSVITSHSLEFFGICNSCALRNHEK